MCKNILIVDRDNEMMKELELELVNDGYKIEYARQVSEVAEKALISSACLVIVNLAISDWRHTSWEVISMIKRFNSSIPIITFIENNSIDVERKVREEGVFFHFVKPFTIQDMKAVIKSATGQMNSKTITIEG